MSDDIIKQIQDMQEISPAIDNYISEGHYVDPSEEVDVDPKQVLIDCRRILLDELKEFGIIPNNVDELLMDGFKIQNALYLREVLDIDYFKQIVTGLNSDNSEELRNILLNQFDAEKAFGLDDLTGFILDLYPNNKKFQMMKYYASDYYVDDNFYQRLFNILEHTVRYIKETLEDNVLLIDYLKYKKHHIENVRKAAEYLKSLKTLETLDNFDLLTRLAIHDNDLFHGDNIRTIALYWKLANTAEADKSLKELYESVEKHHHSNNTHHLEHYIGKEETIGLIEKIEIVSDIYNGQNTKDDYLNDVRKTFEPIDVSTETKQILIAFAHNLDLWKGEEL